MPREPTREQISRAVAQLCEAFAEFLLTDDASRAAILALLLTILARPLIAGPTPFLW